MIVVSDTSPLNYLVLISAINVLPKLLELRSALDMLLRTNIRVPRDRIDAALERDAARKRR